MDSCERFLQALDERNRAYCEAEGLIVQCPVCGEWEASDNWDVADTFGLPLGSHGAQVDNRCATLDVPYMPEDSPYAATCYTHEGE